MRDYDNVLKIVFTRFLSFIFIRPYPFNANLFLPVLDNYQSYSNLEITSPHVLTSQKIFTNN